MSVNNDDLAIKLSNLEGMLTGMAQRFERIEVNLDKLFTLDRAVAEMVVRQDNQQHEVRELTHDVRTCQQVCKAADDLLTLRINTVEKEYNEFKNKTTGVLLALKIFSGVCLSLLAITGKWVYDRADESSKVNYEQQRDIRELREAIERMTPRSKTGLSATPTQAAFDKPATILWSPNPEEKEFHHA